MTRTTKMTSWISAAGLVTAMACSNTAEETAADAKRETGNAVERAGDATAAAGRDAAEAVKDATTAVGGAVANGGRAADAALETFDVKAALMADSRVDASAINVDSDHTTKTVTLKGRVPTAQQKTVAEQIAVEKAIGYRVRNELMVGK